MKKLSFIFILLICSKLFSLPVNSAKYGANIIYDRDKIIVPVSFQNEPLVFNDFYLDEKGFEYAEIKGQIFLRIGSFPVYASRILFDGEKIIIPEGIVSVKKLNAKVPVSNIKKAFEEYDLLKDDFAGITEEECSYLTFTNLEYDYSGIKKNVLLKSTIPFYESVCVNISGYSFYYYKNSIFLSEKGICGTGEILNSVMMGTDPAAVLNVIFQEMTVDVDGKIISQKMMPFYYNGLYNETGVVILRNTNVLFLPDGCFVEKDGKYVFYCKNPYIFTIVSNATLKNMYLPAGEIEIDSDINFKLKPLYLENPLLYNFRETVLVEITAVGQKENDIYLSGSISIPDYGISSKFYNEFWIKYQYDSINAETKEPFTYIHDDKEEKADGLLIVTDENDFSILFRIREKSINVFEPEI